MLVLSRHQDQRIVIQLGNEVVVITVVDIRGDQVRIGTEASPAVKVDREEIYRDKLRTQKQQRKPTNLFHGMTTTPTPFALD